MAIDPTPDTATGMQICVLNVQLGTGSNVMSPATAYAGIEALSTALRDPDIRVIILTGTAEQFCLGVSSRWERGEGSDAAFIDALHDWLLALHGSEKPTIAAIEGEARGAGLALALACDVMVASRQALLSLPVAGQLEGRHGAALWFAAQKLPRTLLRELAFLDTPLLAERAYQCGLACSLVEPGSALRQATKIAEKMAEYSIADLAALRQQVTEAAELPLDKVLAQERLRWLQSSGART